jgi:hypothetical protein
MSKRNIKMSKVFEFKNLICNCLYVMLEDRKRT